MNKKFIDCSGNKCTGKKETVFTHCFNTVEGWININTTPKDADNVCIKYLGKCCIDGDMFAVTDDADQINIYKGIKGDEFE